MDILSKEVLIDGSKWRYCRHQLRSQAGTLMSREFIDHPGSAVIIPRFDDGSILLERNFRHTLGEHLIELPAGTGQFGEPDLTTAQRELLEETGYTATDWRELVSFYPAPGVMNERITVFLAQSLSQQESALEVDEEIELLNVTFDEAISMTTDGRIQDAKTILALWHLERLGM